MKENPAKVRESVVQAFGNFQYSNGSTPIMTLRNTLCQRNNLTSKLHTTCPNTSEKHWSRIGLHCYILAPVLFCCGDGFLIGWPVTSWWAAEPWHIYFKYQCIKCCLVPNNDPKVDIYLPKKNQATKTTPSTRYLSGAWNSFFRIGQNYHCFWVVDFRPTDVVQMGEKKLPSTTSSSS